MKKFFESVLLSILTGISVLLGLSFWLNIKFGFNLFNAQHWNELARLQATNTPISISFYISIGLAIFIFISGLYLIFRPKLRNIFKKSYTVSQTNPVLYTKTEQHNEKDKIVETIQFMSRPPRLNLPKNIGDIAAEKYKSQPNTVIDKTKYNDALSEIFSSNNYLVKKNPIISGKETNLFAIGNNEIVWLGYVNIDLNEFKNAVKKLSDIFSDTLTDIPITIRSFLIDTTNKYDSDDEILIFNNIEDLKEFISENPGEQIEDSDKENFDAYSEYIDTIIQYIKNV